KLIKLNPKSLVQLSSYMEIDFTDVRRVERVVLDPTVALADNMNQKIRQICGDYLAEVSVIPKVEYIDRWNDNNVRVSDLCALKKATAKLSGICKDPPKELMDLAAAATRHMVNEFEGSIDSKPFFIPRKTFSITEFKLHQSDQAMIKARLQRYLSICQSAREHLEMDIKTFTSGSTKNQITDWWLTLIREEVDSFLRRIDFCHDAVPTNYIEKQPEDMARVRNNLSLVEQIMNSFNAMQLQRRQRGYTLDTSLVDHSDKDNIASGVKMLIKELRDRIYPVLDGYVGSCKCILYDHVNVDECEHLSMEKITELIELTAKEMKKKDEKDSAQRWTRYEPQYNKMMKLISDVRYIERMKLLEENPEKVHEKDIVPITGLIMSRFARFENELQTVIEVWGRNTTPTEAQPNQTLPQNPVSTQLP
ncbi:hypothetical protein PROFUN_15078, partial [Planoprotostelium fungivorum]